jgi:hypothetical protein
VAPVFRYGCVGVALVSLWCSVGYDLAPGTRRFSQENADDLHCPAGVTGYKGIYLEKILEKISKNPVFDVQFF